MIMKYVNTAEKAFLAACMLFTTLLLFTNVIMRYFFKSAIFWAEEMLRYLIVWITFIGASTCVKEDSHISIDVLYNILGPEKKRYLKIFINIAGLIFGAAMVFISGNFVMQVRDTAQVSATIGNVPMYIIYMCFPIGFVLYAIHSAEAVYRLFKGQNKEEGGMDP